VPTARVAHEVGGVFEVPQEVARRRHFGVPNDAVDEFVYVGGQALGETRPFGASRASGANPAVLVLRDDPAEAHIKPESVSGGRDQRVTHVHVVASAYAVQHDIERTSAHSLSDLVGDEVRRARHCTHPGASSATSSLPPLIESGASGLPSELSIEPGTYEASKDACEQAESRFQGDALGHGDQHGHVRR
jgi:hypothetical protein